MRPSRLHYLSTNNRNVMIQIPDMDKSRIQKKLQHPNMRLHIYYARAYYWFLLVLCGLFAVPTLLQYMKTDNKVPTVKISELKDVLERNDLNPFPETVLAAILNDWMDLIYGVETPYTVGNTVIPSACTIQDVKEAMKDRTVDKKFRDIFEKIWETYKSGNMTPQSKWTPTSGWDPNLKPVLVFVTPDKEIFNYYPELHT